MRESDLVQLFRCGFSNLLLSDQKGLPELHEKPCVVHSDQNICAGRKMERKSADSGKERGRGRGRGKIPNPPSTRSQNLRRTNQQLGIALCSSDIQFPIDQKCHEDKRKKKKGKQSRIHSQL